MVSLQFQKKMDITDYQFKVRKTDLKKFRNIIIKIQFAKIEDKDAKQFLHLCLNLFIEAKAKELPVENLIHTSNFDLFCEEYIYETRRKYSFLKRLYLETKYIPEVLLIYLGIIEMLPEMMTYGRDYGFSTYVRVNTSMVINTFLALCIIELVLISITRNRFITVSNISQHQKKNVIMCVFTTLIFIAMTIFIKQYMARYMFQINYFLFIGLLAVIILIQNAFSSCHNSKQNKK